MNYKFNTLIELFCDNDFLSFVVDNYKTHFDLKYISISYLINCDIEMKIEKAIEKWYV